MDWKIMAAAIIKEFESCVLTAYHGAEDRPGLYTCGWGSTGDDIDQDTVLTQNQADERLDTTIDSIGATIDRDITVQLTDGEKAALVSFAYNLGCHALEGSTLWRLLLAGDITGAAAQFPRWDRASGNEVAGLLRRRIAEEKLFQLGEGQA